MLLKSRRSFSTFPTIFIGGCRFLCDTSHGIRSPSPRVPHSSVVRASNRYLEGHGFHSCWENPKFFFRVFDFGIVLHSSYKKVLFWCLEMMRKHFFLYLIYYKLTWFFYSLKTFVTVCTSLVAYKYRPNHCYLKELSSVASLEKAMQNYAAEKWRFQSTETKFGQIKYFKYY